MGVREGFPPVNYKQMALLHVSLHTLLRCILPAKQGIFTKHSIKKGENTWEIQLNEAYKKAKAKLFSHHELRILKLQNRNTAYQLLQICNESPFVTIFSFPLFFLNENVISYLYKHAHQRYNLGFH